MADVSYYVALPFTAADDGVAPGEAAECQSSHAAIRKTEQLSTLPATWAPSHSAALAIHPSANSATP